MKPFRPEYTVLMMALFTNPPPEKDKQAGGSRPRIASQGASAHARAVGNGKQVAAACSKHSVQCSLRLRAQTLRKRRSQTVGALRASARSLPHPTRHAEHRVASYMTAHVLNPQSELLDHKKKSQPSHRQPRTWWRECVRSRESRERPKTKMHRSFSRASRGVRLCVGSRFQGQRVSPRRVLPERMGHSS